MTASLNPEGNSYVNHRRRERRQKVLFSSVVISESNCGRVLDISPTGLALQTDSAFGEEFPNFRFKFSPTLAWVSAKGRVVWRNDSKNVVGIEFIGLADEVHDQIRTWMDSKKELSGFGAVVVRPTPPAGASLLPPPESQYIDPTGENPSAASIRASLLNPTETPDATTALETVEDEHLTSRSYKVLWLVGLGLAILLITPYLFQRLHSRKTVISPKSIETARATRPVVPPLQPAQSVPPPQFVAPSQPVRSAERSRPGERPSVLPPGPRTSLHSSQFVVQVAAMLHEENASSLAATLRKLNFPVVVDKLPTERFHHVLVGPYDSLDATLEAQKELQKQGYQGSRSKWNRSQSTP